MTVNHDVTEDMPYDLSATVATTTFTPTNTAYDISIDNLAFIANVSNQNPYKRETAQYRKEQFDNSQEPGEQSLTGWWLRSQTSFHNGAGINYYEPGTNAANVLNRFEDSRGVDVWTVGEAKLLNNTMHSYPSEGIVANNIVSVAGRASNSTQDYIVIGDADGALKKLTLNGTETSDALPTVTDLTSTLASGHVYETVTPDYFKSITSDGTRYFAVCTKAIHVGNIDGTNILNTSKDIVIARHSTSGIHAIKYTKGYLMFGEGWYLRFVPLANPLVSINHGGSVDAFPTGTIEKKHENPSFAWNVIEGGSRFIYAAGYAGSDSEIWAVPFDDVDLTPNPKAAVQVVQLPYGEIVQAMHYYLGYMVIGTNKGVRVARESVDTGALTLGPLLYDSDYAVTGFTAFGNYVFGSTSVMGDSDHSNACLVRIDLSSPFDDGTFAYAYDLQYESDQPSYGIGVEYANDRLHLVTNEGFDSGEIQTETLLTKRSTGWLKTGKIRYGMIEPKFFRYINATCNTGAGDNVTISTIDQTGNEQVLSSITEGLSNQDLLLETLYTKQEQVAFKFTLNNVTNDTEVPTLYGYQIKAVPASKRQRLYQYPLSCYDREMDRFGSVIGYDGRAIQLVQSLENIEQTGRFVTVVDYRTNETYQGIIEEVRFSNESSPDKNESGFGGLLIVTVRKL